MIRLSKMIYCQWADTVRCTVRCWAKKRRKGDTWGTTWRHPSKVQKWHALANCFKWRLCLPFVSFILTYGTSPAAGPIDWLTDIQAAANAKARSPTVDSQVWPTISDKDKVERSRWSTSTSATWQSSLTRYMMVQTGEDIYTRGWHTWKQSALKPSAFNNSLTVNWNYL